MPNIDELNSNLISLNEAAVIKINNGLHDYKKILNNKKKLM